ncbi:hypothetical protein LSAT2_027651 [Lamellibrachia satsuma]|nr:hypothetical protein LSAT2_027651 [Lamellibrachia satsuma]
MTIGILVPIWVTPDLEHFYLEEELLWSDGVATIGNNGHTPKWGARTGCRPRKPSQRKFPSLFAIAVFVHFASHYCILRKMSGRYGKAKRQFGTKPMSRCRQLSLVDSQVEPPQPSTSAATTPISATKRTFEYRQGLPLRERISAAERRRRPIET